MRFYTLLFVLAMTLTCHAAAPATGPAAGPAVSYTPFPLEIIQPHAGLDTTNRFYRAYPGLEYTVPASAIGGVFPYRYALTTAPAGMTINAATGVILWPKPEPGKVNVSLRVTDAAGAIENVQWPITVTTEGWLFVDSAAPNGGSGTLQSPYKTMLDVYGTADRAGKYSEAHKGDFVYVKNGTYLLDGWHPNGTDVQWTYRQPVVFLAYPGDRPTLNLTDRYLFADTTLDNFYLDGFDITPITAKYGFRITGSSSNVTFWRDHFSDLATSAGSNNQSCIMACAGGNGKRWAIIDCEFKKVHHGYGIIGYDVDKLLIARSAFTEMDGSSAIPVGPKVDCHRWVVRENHFAHNARENVWLYYAHHAGSKNAYGNMEVAYNFIEAGNGPDSVALTINHSANDVTLSSYIYRNTIIGNIDLFHFKPASAPMFFRDNVLVSQPHKIEGKVVYTPDGIAVVGPIDVVRAQGNLYFPTREGNLKPDGSLVKPVPDKGYIISPSSNP